DHGLLGPEPGKRDPELLRRGPLDEQPRLRLGREDQIGVGHHDGQYRRGLVRRPELAAVVEIDRDEYAGIARGLDRVVDRVRRGGRQGWGDPGQVQDPRAPDEIRVDVRALEPRAGAALAVVHDLGARTGPAELEHQPGRRARVDVYPCLDALGRE